MNEPLMPGSAANEPAAAGVGPDTVPQGPDAPRTAGELLRAARQAQGVDLASLAAMLKIPLRRLEALEQGRHDELQGPTFERALAQAACRVLKIDPQPILALLPQHAGNTLERVTEGLNTPFRERQGGAGFPDLSLALRPMVLVPVLIVIAALALFYVPTGLWSHGTQPSVVTASTDAHGQAAAPSAAATPATAVPALVAASSAALADAGSAAAGGSTSTAPATVGPAGSAPAAPANAGAASGVDEVLAHAETVPNIPLQVVATADSWVEVVDAQGHSLLSRTVVAGESVGLDGALPMRVKIGNARGTRLTLRGDNVDLTPWTRDNVARVELK